MPDILVTPLNRSKSLRGVTTDVFYTLLLRLTNYSHSADVHPSFAGRMVRHGAHTLIGLAGGTFTHLSVLESETCALRLMAWALDQGLELPINYCGSVYKYRFYPRALRQRWAYSLIKPHEELTEAGYIRSLSIHGSAEELNSLEAHLPDRGENSGRMTKRESDTTLFIHRSLVDNIDWSMHKLRIQYSKATFPEVPPDEEAIRDSRPPCRKPVLNVPDLSASEVDAFSVRYLTPDTAEGDSSPRSFADNSTSALKSLQRFEQLDTGLQRS